MLPDSVCLAALSCKIQIMLLLRDRLSTALFSIAEAGAARAQAQAATQAFPPQVEHVLLDFVGLAVPAADNAVAGRRVASIVRGLMQRRAPAPCTVRALHTASLCLRELPSIESAAACGGHRARPHAAARPPLLAKQDALCGHATLHC